LDRFVSYEAKQKKGKSPFLPLISLKATKGLTALSPGLRSDGDKLTTSDIFSISHSLVILIKCGCLRGYLRCFCYPLRDKTSGMYMYKYNFCIDWKQIVTTRSKNIVCMFRYCTQVRRYKNLGDLYDWLALIPTAMQE
jgi:hypothetical protein